MKQEEINVIVSQYDDYLKYEGIFNADFRIDDDLTFRIYFKYVHDQFSHSIDSNRTGNVRRKYEKFIAKQLNYTRLSLLRVKYYRNDNKASGIKEGFVYIVRNNAWKTFFKIGSSINISDRLEMYQSYSPHRDYEIVESYFVLDRFSVEREYHKALNASHEWIETTFDSYGKSSFRAMVKHFNFNRMLDFNKNIERIRFHLQCVGS